MLQIGWGIVTYALMYLSWNALVEHGFSAGMAPRVIELLVLVVISLIAGASLDFRSWGDILPYSLMWAFEVILLDVLMTLPFAGVAMYYDWKLWVGYALIAIIPLVAPQMRMHRSTDAIEAA